MKGDSMKKLNKKNLKKASPTLLSCFGAVGVIGTSALAVKATPKALRKIRADSRENHNDPNAYTKLEAIQSAWIYYVPSVVMGAATIICIFGANILNKRQQAALTSAYALLKSVVFFAFSVAAYAFTNEIEKRNQAMRIKNLEKEIENINNRNNEPGDEM